MIITKGMNYDENEIVKINIINISIRLLRQLTRMYNLINK